MGMSTSDDDAHRDGKKLPELIEGRRAPAINSGDALAAYGEDDYPLGSSNEQSFDYMRLVFAVWKRRRLIIVTTITGVLLAAIVTLMTVPMYRATATIKIDREAVNVVKVDGFDPMQNGEERTFLQTQYELLQSRSLAEHVATDLNLMDSDRFLPRQQGGLFAYLRSLVTTPDPVEAERAAVSRRNAIVGMLQKNLGVDGIKRSSLVSVYYDHPDREEAQRVANSFATTFISDSLERKYSSSNYARKFLEDRLQQLKIKLEENEKELRRYAEENNIVRLDDDTSTTSAQLRTMNESLARAQDERIRAETIWTEAQKANGFGLTQVQKNDTIQQNRIRRDELAAAYREKLGIYKPGFPEMVQLKARIDEFDSLIRQQVQDVKSSLERDYNSAKAREDKTAAEVSRLEAEMNDQNNKAIQYNILKRESDSTKTLYDGLLQRYKEIGVAGGVGTSYISLVDTALLPGRPITPKVPMNLAIGFALGFLIGVGAAVLLEILDDRFKSPEEVEKILGIPVLGIIPKTEDPDVALSDNKSPVTEAYRSLRTSIQFSTTSALKLIYVTSTRTAEGKTMTAFALATLFSELGARVLLIDLDMRKPSLHRRLNVSNERGFSNNLVSNLPLSETVQQPEGRKFEVITTGPLPPNPAELLASSRMRDLLAEAEKMFDFVIMDGGPLMGLADSVIAARLADATVMVVAANDGRKSEALVGLRRLLSARCRVIGAAFTKFDAREIGYGYAYYGGYYAYGEGPEASSQETKHVVKAS